MVYRSEPLLLRHALAANPNIKVFIMQSSAHAQGAAETIKALPNVDSRRYAVFAGDMDPTMIPIVTSCKDPYKGLVAIGGTTLTRRPMICSRRSCRAWNTRRSPTISWCRSSATLRHFNKVPAEDI